MHLLERIRINHGLDRSEMVKRLEIGESTYSMIINGKRNISKALAFKINKDFKVPFEEIFLTESLHVARSEGTTKAS